MATYKFGDIVKDVKQNIDRANNPYEYYVAGDHMDSRDLTIRRKGRFDTDDVGPAFTRLFKPGQVLYGSRRTYLQKVAVADFAGICANTTFVFEGKDESIFEQRLLPFIMLSDSFTEWAVSHSKGSTNPYVLFSDLADYELNLPSIEDQKVLADKLWAAYRLKEAYKRLLVATDEMVKSQFLEWFGNVTETTSLSSLIAESYPGEWGKEAKNNNGVKVLRTTNFQNNGHIDYSDVIVRYIEQKKIEKKCLRTGDIILERSGGTKDNPVGRVVLFEAEGEYMFNNFTQLLRPIKSVNPYYLFFYLHTSYNADKASMRAMASQTTGIQNLNMTDYMAKEIPLPSLEEQEQFERLYRQADKSKFELKRAIEAIDKVIKSLING